MLLTVTVGSGERKAVLWNYNTKHHCKTECSTKNVLSELPFFIITESPNCNCLPSAKINSIVLKGCNYLTLKPEIAYNGSIVNNTS